MQSNETPPAIIHLVGFPGVGKYTIACELMRMAHQAGSRFVVVDNHLTSNVIFSVLPVDGISPLPATVWERVGDVRAALFRTIEELSPPEWSFVFTNVLTEGVAEDAGVVDRLIELAAKRHSRYVPVRLSCQTVELIRRVPGADRVARHKWVDPDGVRDFVEASEILGIHHPAVIDLDVTSLPASDAAARIIGHIDNML